MCDIITCALDTIELKGVIFQDFVNYKKPCMCLMFPKCDFKCDKQFGEPICQNGNLAATACQTVPIDDLIRSYKDNPITQAIVLQGLEPFDSMVDVYTVAAAMGDFRIKDDLVIYTGYNKYEISDEIISNICSLVPGHVIIKWGRYIPNQEPHFDQVLGINLASDNQYGELIQ